MWSVANGPDFNSIGFHPTTGVLWCIGGENLNTDPNAFKNKVYTINKFTGAATFQSLLTPTIHNTGVSGMVFDSTGTLYFATGGRLRPQATPDD